MSDIRILGDLQSLALAPGDTLVLSCAYPLSDETSSRLRSLVKGTFPGHECLVLSDDLALGVISREDRLGRIEAKLDALVKALADEEEEAPERTLDGEVMGGERDQSQSLG